jgi:hypothetical protein
MKKFYLEPGEELFSIIDKIKKIREDEIVLVVPGGLSALRSIINLRILKEEAISSGKDVAISTSDPLIKKLTQQSGLRLLERESIEKKETRKGWPEQLKGQDKIVARRMTDIIRPVRKEPLEIIEPALKEEEIREEIREETRREEVIPEIKPEKTREAFRFFTKKRLIITGIVICLIVLGFVVYFVLPRVQVVINPRKEAIRFETDVTANKNVNTVNLTDNIIPGQVFQSEMDETKKFPTTGEKEVEEKAKGKITVYNQYSSSEQSLVKTTRFLSKEGKLFRLAETTVIPGATIEEGKIIASTKEVDVIADEAGETYNIGPSDFTIPGFEGSPKYTGFYGKSTEPMAGGAKGKMKVATKDDIEGATQIVSIELKNKAQEEFNKKIPSDLKLLTGGQGVDIIESTSTLKADEPGKEFTITIKVKAWGLAFKESDVLQLIEKGINDKIAENKVLLASTVKLNYANPQADLNQGKLSFTCQVEGQAAWRIDENKVRDELAGKNEVEVRKYLSGLAEIETAKVVFWPFWVNKIPANKNKIKILIEAK